MQMDHISVEPMRAYLLGLLSDDEAAALEEEYFVNRAFFLQVQSAETAFIADYLEGTLGPLEKQRFEGRYLQAPGLRRKVEEVRRQRGALGQAARPSVWANWRLVLAAASIAFLVVGIWVYRSRHQDQSGPVAHVRPLAEVPPSPGKQVPPVYIFLSPGI